MRNKEELARREGMAYALRVAREKGIDALESELKMRGAYEVPLGVSKTDFEKLKHGLEEHAAECILALAMMTLHDEFGMGQRRLERFCERFWTKAECISEDYATWRDNLQILKDECGIEFDIQRYDDSKEAI